MRKVILMIMCLCAISPAAMLHADNNKYSVSGKKGYCPTSDLTLWYLRPVTSEQCADPWMDYALPIGNGQLGAMVYGGVRRDIVQFNEKTLWAGSSTERGAYQNFGYLYIDDTGNSLADGIKNYVRSLDISEAVASASYSDSKNSVNYKTEYIASYPDKAIVINLSASRKGVLSRRITFAGAHDEKISYSKGDGTFSGKLTTVSYHAQFRVTTKGGQTTTSKNGVSVKNADEITIIITAATDYDAKAKGYVLNTSKLASNAKSILGNASSKGWSNLLATHKKDYKEYFDRVSLKLGNAVNNIPTDELIKAYNTTATEGQKRMLEEIYFQYGRYLLIASSRGVDLPNNLQGIWNHSNKPGWQCDMHANINVQMNYWAAEKTALPEMHEKYLNYLHNMSIVQPQWQEYARKRAKQSVGWVNYTENNIFGHCTTWHNDYLEAGAWSCSHLWQHYRYTLDRNFLRTTALPTMLSSVRFWMERLVKDPKDGLWVCPDEWSPEHGPDKSITAHAQQIVWNLFANTIDAIGIIGLEKSGVTSAEFKSIKDKFKYLDNGLLTETYKGNYGKERFGVKSGDKILREWKYTDFAEGNGTEKDHRHLSHLMALYPLNNISPTSEYFQAGINSLRLRGLQSQGWSMGWKMNLWARALEGDSCMSLLGLAFRHCGIYKIDMSPTAGGVYYNLFDAHSPFQIDGNFGVCAAIAEMLLQNECDTISLLPALPKAWKEGQVSGLRAENNISVSVGWRDGKMQKAEISSRSGRPVFIRHDKGMTIKVKDSKGKNVTVNNNGYNVSSFETNVGEVYTVVYAERMIASTPGRSRINFNRTWKFTLGNPTGAQLKGFDDSSWTDANLPHSFSMPYFMWKDVYHGDGWYRKHLVADDALMSKNLTIEFEGSFIDTEVYVNGVQVGHHSGGYTTFSFDITPYINKGDNVIAVHVNNEWKPDVAPRAGDHQFAGGIYRDVWLNATDRLHVSVNGTYITTPVAEKKKAVCRMETEITNNHNAKRNATLRTEIMSPKGKIVSTADTAISIGANASGIFTQTLPQIKSPLLWSPESPSLYKAVTTIIDENGTETDRYVTTFGIRKMEWTADKGFFLNGKHYYLLGANVHQDQAGWGDAVTNKAIERDVQMMKDAGFNFIRGSHYPHDPAFSHACDSIGIIFIQENCFWGMGGCRDESPWGQGAPSSAYPTRTEDQKRFEQSVLRQLKESIRQHRNSPSIAAWSMSNEPFFCSNSVDDKMKNLLNISTDSARKWEPSRAVAVGGVQRKGIDKLGKGAIALYNGDGATMEEGQNPGVPNMVSEYGSTSCDRPGSFIPGWGSVGDGLTNRPVWRSGHAIWCGFDHGTVGGFGLGKMGLVDYFRLPKRSYYWYQQAYKEGRKQPKEPTWPQPGEPAKLDLSASSNILESCDGTDDAQLIVTILDKDGKHISNSIPVTLRIVSGPGELPTGRNITFIPPTAKSYKDVSKDPACDIRIQDGQAAIAFRSYHAGKTIIEATAEGTTPARIEIETKGYPAWREGTDTPVANRPYSRYQKEDKGKKQEIVMTLASIRPTESSSDLPGTNKTAANDGNPQTVWKPAANDKNPWWNVFLEGQYSIKKVEIDFTSKDNYKFTLQVSKDGKQWMTIAEQAESDKITEHFECSGNFGDNISYMRILFTTPTAGLRDVRVGGY